MSLELNTFMLYIMKVR